MSVMTAWEHLRQLDELDRLSELSVNEVLYAFGMVGNCIQVHRSEASNISPWMLSVPYVSCDRFDTTSVMCALDSGFPLHDMNHKEVTDALVLMDPKNPIPFELFRQTKLFKTYTSILFTRNPSLFIPAQQTALLMISLVTAIKQLAFPETRSLRHVQTVFDIIYTIRRQLGKGIEEG
eukprot:TRINITY_DN15689_c0_g1_i5.p1 TRINITY_DN15689_c0_g1~~TRINITY_DN15689_c0_g1_i5.p1  ORF type:complete len:178 (+),score=12.94 TRINITY_DN15689_c0_g1_i5:128-661(+)